MMSDDMIVLARSLQEIERTATALLARIERGEPSSAAMWLRAIRAEARAALRAVGEKVEP